MYVEIVMTTLNLRNVSNVLDMRTSALNALQGSDYLFPGNKLANALLVTMNTVQTVMRPKVDVIDVKWAII